MKNQVIITVRGTKGVDTVDVVAFLAGVLRGQNIIAAIETRKEADEARVRTLVADEHSLALAMGKIAQSQQKDLEDQTQVLVTEGDIIDDQPA